MTPLTQVQLDQGGCGNPDCDHDHTILWLRAGCHPRAGLAVAYNKATGRMMVACKKCEKPVAEIAVAASLSGAA